ncbi:MAG: AAA family ATPase [Bradyrhizobium sp.]|uniref:AAA family ATPase n=1 Tax=Bradyrhizobium sp. TaxID=376 RepID=UPI003D0D24B8
MKTLAFLSQKGGSGKTTLAVHTAVAAREAGQSVVLVDTDPQRSAMAWGDARGASEPAVVAVSASGLERLLQTQKAAGVELAIIDTAPHAAPEAARIARLADLVAIPCRPSAFDLAAVENAVRIVRAAKVRSVFVLSACPFRAPEIGEARDALSGYGFPISPEITDRRPFARAVATGRAVTEFEGDGRAAAEVRALWGWLKEQMG